MGGGAGEGAGRGFDAAEKQGACFVAGSKDNPLTMQAPYIPSKDADFDSWLNNFSTLLTASPTTYGLTAPDAVIVAGVTTTWNSTYAAATNPGTRTTPAIAAKDAARNAATATVRPYATTISRNAGVTNEDKTDIGVNLPNPGRTPVPPPTTQAVLSLVSAIHNQQTLAYRDSSTPTSKAKPAGAISLEVWQAIGTSPAVSPATASPLTLATKSPFVVGTLSPDAGKFATYFGRWTTRSGPGGQAQSGPWSAPLSVVIV
jgi:hypothetical protein